MDKAIQASYVAERNQRVKANLYQTLFHLQLAGNTFTTTYGRFDLLRVIRDYQSVYGALPFGVGDYLTLHFKQTLAHV